MRLLIGISLASLTAGVALGPVAALANDSVTCWAPNSKLLATDVSDYWTQERMDNSVVEPEQAPGDMMSFELQAPPALGAAERAPIADAPYKFGGKLFYTRGGVDYNASAQFVADDNILIGAAHSLWKGTDAATRIRFVQGYSNGGGTTYDIDMAAVLTEWTRISTQEPSMGKSQFDYSVMRTTKPSAVGRYDLGETGVDAEVTITGYPGRLEGGAYMYRETARILVKAGNSYDARPHPMFGGGASGGAWFIGSSEPYKAVSVVSAGDADGVYGPAFTKDTADMVAYVKGGCQ